LAGLFGEVLGLCARPDWGKWGWSRSTGRSCTRTLVVTRRDYEQLAEEILAEADAVDREEDERFGDARGDGLPPQLSTHQGRRGWLRDARRRLDEKRAAEARPIARSRPERLRESKRRLEDELATECRANADHEAYRRAA
jgi:hypothetical protein